MATIEDTFYKLGIWQPSAVVSQKQDVLIYSMSIRVYI